MTARKRKKANKRVEPIGPKPPEPPKLPEQRSQILPLLTLSMFLSAALLFLMQPMFGKMILPVFGGAPAVWITSLVFFQVMLLAGYLYVHATTAWLGTRRQAALHAVLLLTPLIILPIRVASGWGLTSPMRPISSVFLVLLASVGLPFFVVSTTAPLLQRWFGSTTHTKARDPFFLYAASNLGSIGALLAYPILVEPKLRLDTQTRAWSIGYVLLIVAVVACALAVRKSVPQTEETTEDKDDAPPIPWKTRLRWIALAAIPSSLMLSVTTHITTDIAPVPLLWVIPLTLYLVTFVLAFSPRTAFLSRLASYALPVAVLIPLATIFSHYAEPPIFILFHLFAFFLAAMACHGELAASRPGVRRLTEFYVWLAIGGAVGGLFNVLIAPIAFRTLVEYPLALILACVASGPPFIARPFRRRPVAFGLALGALVFAASLYPRRNESLVANDRSFYGVHRIINRSVYRVLMDGNTNHGAQSLQPVNRCVPLSYYYPTGPVGNLFATFKDHPKSNVAIVGLGTGSISGYAKPGQQWTFYEIDPDIERIARNPRYFTFLRDCAPQARVIIGDARISLANQPDGAHDVIVVDAFTSDVIPVHLLTREAMALYVRKLAPGGVLAFHISNRYANLRDVLARLARDANLVAYLREDRNVTPFEGDEGKLPSVWVIMARSSGDLRSSATRGIRWLKFPTDVKGASWTDNYSNVLETLRIR